MIFRDTGKEFELQGDLLKMLMNKNSNLSLARVPDENLLYDFAKKVKFDVRGPGNKSTRDGTLIKMLKPPGLSLSASGIPITIVLPSDPDELCDGLK